MFTSFIRTIILYFLIVVGFRLMGKRQVGELEPSELALSLLIADLASVPMQELGIPLHAGVVPIMTLLCLTMLLSVLTMKSMAFRNLLCGRPSILIRNGQIDQLEMRRSRLTVDELLEELRSHGCFSPAEVMYAILETNGILSVFPRAQQRAVTPEDLKVTVSDPHLPLVVISDGVLLEQSLKNLGRDQLWLERQLSRRQCTGVKQVFLMMADPEQVVCFIPKTIV